MNAVCRAFERDAVLSGSGNKKRRNLFGYILCAVGVGLCMLLFWLMAVLLEPDSVPAAEEISGMVSVIQRYKI